MGGVVETVKKVFKPVVRFVKKVVSKVVKTAKKIVKKVVGYAKSIYKRYIKPWAGPVLNFAKKWIPGVGLIYKGYQVVKSGIKMVKNGYKACRNYLNNKPYKKYWNKAKNYGKKFINSVGKSIRDSTVFGKVYNAGKKIYSFCKTIYDTGKKIYNNGKRVYKKISNTINFVRNSFNYVKNMNNKKVAKKYFSNMKRNWKSSFLSGFTYKKYINNNYYNKINNIIINNRKKLIMDSFKQATSRIKKIFKPVIVFAREKIKLIKKTVKNITHKVIGVARKIYNKYENIWKPTINKYYNFGIYLNKLKSKMVEYNNIKEKYQNYKESLRNMINKKKEYIIKVKQFENFTYQVKNEYFRQIKVEKPYNYCLRCHTYCCQVCQTFDENGISLCTYFNGGRNCPRCPGKCPRCYHVKYFYWVEKYFVTENIVNEKMKEEYYKFANEIKYLEKEFNSKFTEVNGFIFEIKSIQNDVKSCIYNLEGNFSNNYNKVFDSVNYEIKNYINLAKNIDISDIIGNLNNFNSEFRNITFVLKN